MSDGYQAVVVVRSRGKATDGEEAETFAFYGPFPSERAGEEFVTAFLVLRPHCDVSVEHLRWPEIEEPLHTFGLTTDGSLRSWADHLREERPKGVGEIVYARRLFREWHSSR